MASGTPQDTREEWSRERRMAWDRYMAAALTLVSGTKGGSIEAAARYADYALTMRNERFKPGS